MAAAAVVAAVSPAAPTARPVVDAFERVGFAAVVAMVLHRCPRQLRGATCLAVVAWALAGLRHRPEEAVMALLATAAVGLVPQTARRGAAVADGLLAGAIIGQGAVGTFSGGWVVAAVVVVAGVGAIQAGAPRPTKPSVGLAIVAIVAVVAAGAVLAAQLLPLARTTRRDAGALTDGRELLSSDPATLRPRLQSLARSLDALGRDANRPAGLVLGVVPVAAQHVAALRRLSARGADLARSGDQLLATGDIRSLQPKDGRIDLATIERLHDRTDAFVRDLASLRAALERERSRLLGPVPSAIAKVDAKLANVADAAVVLDQALARLPDMLGASGPRNIFVAFLATSELRGAGGIVGNFAVLHVDQGRVTLTRAGRDSDLNEDGVPAAQRVITGPSPDWFQHYARYQPATFWQDMTVSPTFSDDAAAMASVAPQSGVGPVDMVVGIDAAGVAALLGAAGPATVPGLRQPVTAGNAVSVLGIDQYIDFDQTARLAFLDALIHATFDRLLSPVSGPSFTALACIATAAHHRHVLLWSAQPAEQALFDRLRISGDIPDPKPDGSQVVVALDNSGGSKLDWFLTWETSAARITLPDGRHAVAVKVALHNSAPRSGLPDYVIANNGSSPRAATGDNPVLVSVFGSGAVADARVDGRTTTHDTDQEGGYTAAAVRTVVPALGGQQTVEVDFVGPSAATEVATWRQPPTRDPPC